MKAQPHYPRSLDINRDKKHPLAHKGSALVIVLGAVVLITGIILAFFSRSFLDRQISNSSANLIKSDKIARSALNIIIGEFREEIRANSTGTTISGINIYIPKNSSSLVPLRDQTVEANLIRSSSSSPVAGTGETAVSSTINSTTPSINHRYVSPAAWDKICLRSTPVATDSAPNWILFTRSGPNTNAALTPAQAADSKARSFVLGRYAYAVYDEGGLLDINIAGAPSTLDTVEKGRKGSVVLADLTALGLTTTQSDALIAWRNASCSSTNYIETIFDDNGTSATGFLQTRYGDNTFRSRLDLLKYASSNGTDMAPPITSLKYLATSIYERNSPSYAPDDQANPSAVKPGFKTLISPVTKKPLQRFSLSRFRLLDQDPSALSSNDKNNIIKYFGLTPDSNSSNTYRAWHYRASTIDTPAAAIASGRDPNVFELVKGAINNGSLGVSASNSTNTSNIPIRDIITTGTTYTPETNIDDQVARIVANMIDQYDSDNYPTTITLGTAAGATTVYGIESLPYFSALMAKVYYPSATSSDKAIRFYFELWNPHQSKGTGPSPSNVRIVVNSDATYYFKYNGHALTGGADNVYLPFPSTYFSSGGGIDIDIQNNDYTTKPARIPGIKGTGAMTLNTSLVAISNPVTDKVFMYLSHVVFSLQFKDTSGQWHTYNTFAGMDNDNGNTGFQIPSNTVALYNLDQDPDGSSKRRYGLVFYKPDPRTFRYRTGACGDYYDPSHRGNNDANEQLIDQPNIAPQYANPTLPIMLYKNNVTSAGGRTIKLALDSDGTSRMGDGYLDTGCSLNPISNMNARPIILNRPFRSPAELGYVFRDSPWKSLNFFSSDSGDTGLLDIFSLEESEVVAGKANLNTSQPKVLQALISGAAISEAPGAATVSSTTASTLATDITNCTKIASTAPAPFQGLGSLLTNMPVYSASSGSTSTIYPAMKIQREAPLRALSAGTQTRTWNLLIDLVAQSGRYPKGATALDNFLVEGERHYWLHVAIDRFTGEILKTQLEIVND